jgi:hypothetical protein
MIVHATREPKAIHEDEAAAEEPSGDGLCLHGDE